MKVFKFGGASVKTAADVKNVAAILKKYAGQKILIVISAMGKTTNALEKVVTAFYAGNKDEALLLFEAIKEQHVSIYNLLISEEYKSSLKNEQPLADFFTEIEWLLHDKPVRQYDYYYDQIVCVGELLSTAIVSHYLLNEGIKNRWIDVRDILRTDANFRDATVDWAVTSEKVAGYITPLFQTFDFILTQGFIGATDENQSTTLGREGSDYSAALFANILQAENQTIWKDVEGVMNADPKEYSKAQLIKNLNYKEVVEMAYYGAQVIHPKTIKPLQNKGIPLYVRSFLHPEKEGTEIHNKGVSNLPPIIVYKKDQVLVQLGSKDFSFVGEGLTAEIYGIFEQLKFRPNLTQNAAISMLCVVDDHPDKVGDFALAAAQHFDVQVTKSLLLLTIRHYTLDIIEELCANKEVILRQQTPETIQLLMNVK